MIRNKTDSIVIKPKMSPIFRLLLIIVPVILFVAGVASAYLYAHWEARTELELARNEIAELTDRYEFLNQRYTEVQDSFIQLRRQISIDDSAYKRLGSELEQSNKQIAELTSELKFYRSIISPQEGEHGVRVQEIEIRPTEQPNTFRYKLVLIQTLQKGKELSGNVRFSFKGKRNGETTVIKHPGDGMEKLKVNFKYFQSITGTFELPEAFVPLEVRIDLSASKNKPLIDEKWYAWSDIAAEQAS